MNRIFRVMIALAIANTAIAQSVFTHADTLRGTQTPNRVWWNALKYDIEVSFEWMARAIVGSNTITYKVIDRTAEPVLQIDLMRTMQIDSVISEGKKLEFTRDGDAWLVKERSFSNDIRKIKVYYHGIPHMAQNPPWDGGVIWSTDKNSNIWISIACEGLGASSWYPNKDQLLDEPDSAEIHIAVRNDLTAVSNGRMSKEPTTLNDKKIYHWKVTNPINNYNIIPYIGKYSSFGEVYNGVAGPLDVTYWALDQDLATAKNYWPSRTKETLKTLEKWFGPYPFYGDGFKMVQAPHLGMEHQGAIAYGNGFAHGYLGHDLSKSGWGMRWDFIILHETAHEWYGNSITAADIADLWIHEAFATYAEVLYIEDRWGYNAGVDYLVGRQAGIQNDEPIIGPYGVNKEGSGDMYPKGACMIHMIRKIVDDDKKFRQALLEMNKKFFHKEINTDDVLKFWNSYSPRDLTPVFDQYLKTASIPTLSYKVDGSTVSYKWEKCVPGFNMPVKLNVGRKTKWIYPTTEKQDIKLKGKIQGVSRDFYIQTSIEP